jgi:hypothetical protein
MAADVHDIVMFDDLLHSEKRDVLGDQAHQGQSEMIKEKVPEACNRTNRSFECLRITQRNRGLHWT